MSRTTVIGVLGVVIIIVALGLNFLLPQGDNVPPIEEAETAEPKVAEAKPPVAKPEAAAPAEAEPAAPAAPGFDVVRVSEAGDTVIAGRASPGAEVQVLDGGELIGTVTADDRGEWVLLPDEPLKSGSRELSLQSTTPAGEAKESDDVVVLVVPERGKDIAGRETEAAAEPLALLVPKAGSATEDLGTRVLQKPSVEGEVEAVTGTLSLDHVDYDDNGNLSLGGRGTGGANVQVYLDNGLVGQAQVDGDGRWRLKPEQGVEPGVYTLRLDEVKDDKMIARLELPFSRAEPLDSFAEDAFIVVQPGNSLWRIARRTLGDGVRYTVIYQANQDQIRDPDLIYPGQIFEIPGQ